MAQSKKAAQKQDKNSKSVTPSPRTKDEPNHPPTTDLTDRHGVVRFPVLRPGPGYEISVSYPGFSPLRYDDLRVRLNEVQTVRVQIHADQAARNVESGACLAAADLDPFALELTE